MSINNQSGQLTMCGDVDVVVVGGDRDCGDCGVFSTAGGHFSALIEVLADQVFLFCSVVNWLRHHIYSVHRVEKMV